MSDLATIGFKADTTGLKAAERSLDSLAKKGETSEKRINKSVDNTNQSFKNLRTSIGLAGAALTALGSARLTQELITQSDAWKNITSQIRQVTKSETQLLDVRKELLTLSKETRSDLTNTVDLYAQITRSTKELGTSQAEVMNITETLNNLFVAGGKPISEVSGAIKQLTQGFAAGVLRGDEFNSVAEGAPKIMDALAAKLNMTRGELREFSATGGITAKIMVDALKDYSTTAQKLADQTTKTWGQSMENATTNITEFVGGATLLNQAVDSLSLGIEDFTENLNAFATAAQTMVTVVGIGMVGAYGKSAVAKIADLKATQAGLAATHASSVASLNSAKSEAALAVSKVAGLKTTIAAIQGEIELEAVRLKAQYTDVGRIATSTRMAEIGVARLALTKQLTAAEVQLAASGAAVATAQSAVATTAAAASVSTRALGVATKFLLGPWGLLLTAVGMGVAAFYSSGDAAEYMTKQVKKMNTEVENSTGIYAKYLALTDKAKNAELSGFSDDRLKAEMASSIQQIDLYEKRLETLVSKKASMARQSDMAEKLRAEQTRLEEIEKLLPKASTAYNMLTSSTRNLIQSLDPLFGKTEELAAAQKQLNDAYTTGAIGSVEELNRLMTLLNNSYSEAEEGASDSSLAFTDMIVALEMQRQELIMTADEFEVYNAKMEAMANGITDPAMLSAIEENIRGLQKQRKEIKEQEKGLDLSGLISDIENFGGAWSNTGNVIVDTFGTMADSIDDYMSRMSSLDKLQTEIDEKRKVKNADLIELDRQQMLLNTEKNRAELDGISSIAGAVGGLFDEKTAAAKAFAAIERAIAVAQIAMSIEKALASNTETATVIANETAKQSVLATTAVVNQGTGDPYSAFIRIAAMGALMATLVSGFSGGSGSEVSTSSSEYRQENQGTGTVLGSLDKSASLVNAFDRMEDLEIDQYAVLKDMRASLLDLNSNIKNLVSGLVSRFGNFGVDNFSGELGKTSKLDSNGYFEKMGSEILSVVDPLLSATGHGDPLGALVDSLVGSFNTTKTSLTDSGISIVSQTMEDIIESGLVDAQAYFDIKTKKKSFWGLSSSSSSSTEFQGIDEQLQHEMALIFSNIGTSINTAVDILGLEVSNNLDNFVIDIPNLSLKDLSGEEIQAELEAVFSAQSDLMATYLVPNLQDFQKVGEGLYETLIRVAQEQAIFNTSIERMGFDLSELSAVMQIEVAQSIASLVGGFENFSDLTSSFFDNFYSDAEKMTVLEASLTSVFDSLGLSLTTSREDFKDLVSGLDLTTIEGQELLATLLEINPALSEYIDELERVESKRASMNIELLELQGMSEEALALQREIELAAMDESLRALQILIYAEEDRIAALNAQETASRSALSALEESVDLEKQRLQAVLDVAKTAYDAELDRIDALKVALNAENDLRQANLDEAETALNSAFDAEISLIQQLADERINALNEERTALTATSSAMSSLISNINSSLGLDGSTDLIGALAAAQRGDFSAAQNLDVNALTNLDSSGFSSAADLNVQTAINQNRLAEISGLASGKLSETEMLIASIDKQILDTQAVADEQIEALNNQLDIMLGIDNTVLSIADASAKYRSAKTSLDALNFETELAKYDMLIESAEDVYSLHEQAYDEQIIALDNIVSTNTALLYQTFNINQSIQSIADAIITLETSLADSANYQREIAKNTTTTANAAKEAKLNGQDVRVIT